MWVDLFKPVFTRVTKQNAWLTDDISFLSFLLIESSTSWLLIRLPLCLFFSTQLFDCTVVGFQCCLPTATVLTERGNRDSEMIFVSLGL